MGKAIKRVQGKKIDGNLKGEGQILGGVWVVHPDPAQGVIYQYRENSWGDNVVVNDLQGLQEAINKLPGRMPGQPVSMPGIQAPLMAMGAPMPTPVR